VHLYGPLLQPFLFATAGNDSPLGANEAPPGDHFGLSRSQLDRGLDKQILNGEVTQFGFLARPDALGSRHSGPEFPNDPGDRNRTRPFAFTGNRFEFRAVGSNQSVAGPLVAMNTIAG